MAEPVWLPTKVVYVLITGTNKKKKRNIWWKGLLHIFEF